MSLRQTIIDHLRTNYPRIVHKGEIGRKAVLEWGYENENAGRRCRELENEEIIEKIENEKGEAQYRWIPPPSEVKRVEPKWWTPPNDRLKREEKVEESKNKQLTLI